jgi:hypothetical protein
MYNLFLIFWVERPSAKYLRHIFKTFISVDTRNGGLANVWIETRFGKHVCASVGSCNGLRYIPSLCQGYFCLFTWHLSPMRLHMFILMRQCVTLTHKDSILMVSSCLNQQIECAPYKIRLSWCPTDKIPFLKSLTFKRFCKYFEKNI